MYKGACTVPSFCSRLLRCGSWVFWSLCIFYPEFASSANKCMWLFLVLYSFFVFCCLRRGVSRCRHCSTASRGLGFQTVSLSTERKSFYDYGCFPRCPSLCPSSEAELTVYVLSHSVVSNSATPWGITHRLLCPWRLSRQEYWSGLSCPLPGDLPDSGIEPVSPVSLAVWADSLPNESLGNLTLPQNCGFLSLLTIAVLLFYNPFISRFLVPEHFPLLSFLLAGAGKVMVCVLKLSNHSLASTSSGYGQSPQQGKNSQGLCLADMWRLSLSNI